MRIILAALLIPCLASMEARGQVAGDIPKTNWAYEAVQDLATRGLIKGFPPDANFFGGRTVTRFEMASIIYRVLQQLDDLYAKKVAVEKLPEGVKPEQLAQLERLVEEFKPQLAVVGADITNLKKHIADVEADVAAARNRIEEVAAQAAQASSDAVAARKDSEAIKKSIGDLKQTVDVTSKEVDRITKVQNSHKISGYIQGRFDAIDVGRTSLFTNTAAGSTGQTPTSGGPSVGGPFYGFQVRRARVNFTGPITKRADYRVQLDGQSGSGAAVYDANISIADFPAKNVKARFGLFSPVFGYELPTSSSVRESPERIFGLSTTLTDYPIFKTSSNATGGIVTPGSVQGLFVNQQRDVGAEFAWAIAGKADGTGYGNTQATLSVINGDGRSVNGMRNMNNGVDLLGRIEAPLATKLQLGLSGYYGSFAVRGGPPSAATGLPIAFKNADKILGGADIRWQSPWGTTFRAEWFGGQFESTPDRAQFLPGNHAYAWYFTARHPVSNKIDLVTKYDEYYPISQDGKTAGGLGRMDLVHKTISAGILYNLDAATRFRLWYMKGLTPYDPSATSGPMRNRLGLVTGEIQVGF